MSARTAADEERHDGDVELEWKKGDGELARRIDALLENGERHLEIEHLRRGALRRSALISSAVLCGSAGG
jgi:hypothetical protein